MESIVRKTCRLVTNTETNSRKGFADTNKTPRLLQRNGGHSQQQAPNNVGSDTTPTSPTALTLSHLINERTLSTLFHLEELEDNIIEKDLGHKQANQKLFYLTQLQQSVWNCYLRFLRERQEANTQKLSQTTATERDLVLVYDDTSRSTWKLGKNIRT